MATTKASLFNQSQKRLAELTRALGHPARIAILQMLIRRNTCICGDITDELPLAQSTVSQHLKALKKAGIIKGEIQGVRTCYCINKEGVKELDGLLGPFIRSMKTSCREDPC